MPGTLKDKVAIITGAGHGLGSAFALKFAENGARLLLPDIDLEKAEQTAAKINSEGGRAVAMQVDISDEEQTRQMAEKVISEYGSVDILINNAASTRGVGNTPWNAWTPDDWDRIFAVNAKGTWLCCRAVAPLMKKQAGGKIINLASDIIKLPGAQMGLAYACSKAAIYTLTQTLARVLGPDGITVNAIAPGLTATDSAVQQTPPAAFELTIDAQCLKRRAEPEDIVGTALFLAASDSGFITGQVIMVDGGAVMP